MPALTQMSATEARAAGYTRKAWLDAVRKRQYQPNALPPQLRKPQPVKFSPSYPCAFRGRRIGTTECATCGGRTQDVETFACEKHGKCTIKTLPREKGISTCQVCDDRQLFREEVPFADYMNKYEGRTAWVIGSGPTGYDYKSLVDVTDPVFTINNWAWVQQYVPHDEQFWFALDSECQPWLPDLRGVAVLDLNEEEHGGSKWGKDRKSAYLIGAKKVCFWQSTPGMSQHGPNQKYLEQTREELRDSRRLYRYQITIMPLIHFAWYCGFTTLNLVGCEGNGTPDRMYDERGLGRIRTGPPIYRSYQSARIEQDRVMGLLGIEANYVGSLQE